MEYFNVSKSLLVGFKIWYLTLDHSDLLVKGFAGSLSFSRERDALCMTRGEMAVVWYTCFLEKTPSHSLLVCHFLLVSTFVHSAVTSFCHLLPHPNFGMSGEEQPRRAITWWHCWQPSVHFGTSQPEQRLYRYLSNLWQWLRNGSFQTLTQMCEGAPRRGKNGAGEWNSSVLTGSGVSRALLLYFQVSCSISWKACFPKKSWLLWKKFQNNCISPSVS